MKYLILAPHLFLIVRESLKFLRIYKRFEINCQMKFCETSILIFRTCLQFEFAILTVLNNNLNKQFKR